VRSDVGEIVGTSVGEIVGSSVGITLIVGARIRFSIINLELLICR
jgi:hypothetical protein